MQKEIEGERLDAAKETRLAGEGFALKKDQWPEYQEGTSDGPI